MCDSDHAEPTLRWRGWPPGCTPTPDLPIHLRPDGFSWPVHRHLLSHGVLVAEQLANLRSLAGHRVEFLFALLPLVGSDGSPCRVLARPTASAADEQAP